MTKNFVEEWRSLWKPDLKAITYNGKTCDPTRVDPKVLQWAKQNCSHKPHFIKIINYDAAPDHHRIPSNCKLRFPTPFAKKYFRKLERVVKLENEDHGKTWKVAFRDLRWHPTWQQGWFRFASDNNLKPGDVIVFVLVGKSHFRLSHFDEHGNKRRTDRAGAAAKKECESAAPLSVSRALARKNFVEEWRSLWKPDLQAIAYDGRTCDPTRVDSKVLQWAKQNCSHKPHFIKIINYDAAPDHHRIPSRCKLRFPTPFAEQHFRKLERVVKLENEDHGKTWKVAFQDLRHHPTWRKGWFRFASDNNLKPGDVIVFVLVGNSHFRFSHFDEYGNKSSTDRAKKEYASISKRAPSSLPKNNGIRDSAHDEVVIVDPHSKRRRPFKLEETEMNSAMARPRPRKNFVEEWRNLWKPDLEAITYDGQTSNPTRVNPKVLQWAKQNCSHKPHFIKIINNDAATDQHRTPSRCKLRFPSPFAKQHFRKLEKVVKLENEDHKKTWKVAFQDLRHHPTWRKGWFRFASDNYLKPGDVIVFVLVGNSHFRFSHFDEDGNKSSGAAVKKECASDSSQTHEDSIWDHAECDEERVKSGDLKCGHSSFSKTDGIRDGAHDKVLIVDLGQPRSKRRRLQTGGDGDDQ